MPVHWSFFLLTPEEKSVSAKNALCFKVSFPTFTYTIRIYFTFQLNKHICLYVCVKATHISWNITYFCYISRALIFSKIFYFRKSDYHSLNLFYNLLMGQSLHLENSAPDTFDLLSLCQCFVSLMLLLSPVLSLFWHCKDVWFSLILKYI